MKDMENNKRFIKFLFGYLRFLTKTAKEKYHQDIKYSMRHLHGFVDDIYLMTREYGFINFKTFEAMILTNFTYYIALDSDYSSITSFLVDKQNKGYIKRLYQLFIKTKGLLRYINEEKEEISELLNNYLKEVPDNIRFNGSKFVIVTYKKLPQKPNEKTDIFDDELNLAQPKCLEKLNEYLKEENIMRSQNFTINEEKKIVTLVDQNKSNKEVTMVKTHKDDDFDKYVGAALAYMYNKFGSKSAYRRWVDENSKVIPKKKVKEDIKKPRPKKQSAQFKDDLQKLDDFLNGVSVMADEYMEAQIPEVKEVK